MGDGDPCPTVVYDDLLDNSHGVVCCLTQVRAKAGKTVSFNQFHTSSKPTTLSHVAALVSESGVFCILALSKWLARLGPLLVLQIGVCPNTGFSLWSLSSILSNFSSGLLEFLEDVGQMSG